ncbi:MAG: hypothetical protein WAK26_18645 [Terracidiphilus sp.]
MIALIAGSLSMGISGQGLSASDKQIVESARSKYYNLEELGFQSATCKVNFDFSTIPSLAAEDKETTYRLLRAVRFSLNLEGKNPSVLYSYPSGTTDTAQQRAAPTTNLLKSLATGVFQTWPTKGLRGPIPAFDSQIQGVVATNDGYVVTLKVPGGPVQVEINKDYLVRRIVSVGGKIDERPLYSPTPDGLIFSGVYVIDDSEQGGRVEVQYELENTIVDGLRLPTFVHLRVNQNIDVKFSLSDCSVERGRVLSVKPPAVPDQK